jgi:hypothetical protein
MTKSKPTLQDLLDKCDESTAMSKEDQKWNQIPPVGKEDGSDEYLNSQDENIELISIFEQRKGQLELENNIDDL